MGTLHLPKLHGHGVRRSGHRSAGDPDHPPHRQLVERLESMERVIDLLVLVLVFVLAAAMLYGLATASGTADWLK
ncbi:MAG: hypothetical protein KY446_11855 [Proteobacteria bacterium]|nr:hypothetical protein [Pseudomonadota bacterium]MBW3618412.1 hypothetical protein [Pseudomonadota bacterium]